MSHSGCLPQEKVRKSQEFRVAGQEKTQFSKKSGKVRKMGLEVSKSQENSKHSQLHIEVFTLIFFQRFISHQLMTTISKLSMFYLIICKRVCEIPETCLQTRQWTLTHNQC